MSETDSKTHNQQRSTSGLAQASLGLAVISVVGFCVPGLVFVLGGAALILGILAVVQIRMSRRLLLGRWSAVIGIITAAVVLTIAVILGPGHHHQRTVRLARQLVCGTNIRTLAKAMKAYANEYGREYPPPDNWCDLLIEHTEVSNDHFFCVSARKQDDTHRCHYALNPKAEPSSPNDVVLLFETKGGWNQVGGSDVLTTENHSGEGCNVAFVDTSVRFVETEDLGKLKWEGEESEKGPNRSGD
jgi:hypothetical protein